MPLFGDPLAAAFVVRVFPRPDWLTLQTAIARPDAVVAGSVGLSVQADSTGWYFGSPELVAMGLR